MIILNKYYYYYEPFEIKNNSIYGFIKKYNNLLSDIECDYLINITKKNMFDSTLLNTDGSNFIDKNIRSSRNYYFKKNENQIIGKIENIISKELNIPIENIEPIQLTEYQKNQQYIPHYDFILDEKNQRTHTFIIYLNTLEENDGGATNFTLYKEKIYPKKGNAICFNNIDAFNRLNLMSLHGGDIVKSDNVKYILSIWIRKERYS